MRKLIVAVLMLCGTAFSQGIRFDNFSWKTTNVGTSATKVFTPAAGSTITVCKFPGSGVPCTNKASIYSEHTLTTPLSNPVTVDTYGNFGFWIAPGTYDYTVTGTGVTATGPYTITLPGNAANITDFGAICDGSTDISSVLQVAINSGVKTLNYPMGTCVVNSAVTGVANQNHIFNGTTITHTSVGTTIFSFTDVNDWSFTGPVTLLGVNGGTVAGVQTAEALLYIAGGHRFHIENVTAKNSNGWCIKRDPGTDNGLRGDKGQLSDIVTNKCYTGFEGVVGGGAEYMTITNYQATGNTWGAILSAGNITLSACNLVDNVNGIGLTNGTNHGHGIVTGCNINHSTTDNVFANTITNGFSFIGNHIYANDTISGFIHLSASHGIQFVGNFIDSVIKNDSADGSMNFFAQNYMVSATGQTTPTGTSGQTNLMLIANTTNSGYWSLNNDLNIANGSISAGGKPAGTFVAGDVGAARTTTTGCYFIGSDAAAYLCRGSGVSTLTGSAIGYARSNVALANGANSNINIGDATNIKITGPTGVFSVSGFTGGSDGRRLILYNSVAFAMTITNDATSTAANRIMTLTGSDVTLRAGTSAATFIYDSVQSRWILVSTN